MIRLTKRERRFAAVLTAAVAVWSVYGLAIKPACDRIATLQRLLPQKAQELAEIQAASNQYVSLAKESADIQSRLAKQDPNFELLSFLESMIEQHQLTDRFVDMQRHTLQPQAGYSQTVVEINFESIRLGELVDFLQAIETSNAPVATGYLHIRPSQRGPSAGLDATVQIQGPQRRQNAVAALLP